MEQQIALITYKELLDRIDGQQNHLLVANGFNSGLGVSTGYCEIFQKMIEYNNIYKDAAELFEKCNHDLEKFVGQLETRICSDPFLTKYVHNKIKLDFMQATHEIVKSKMKDIYAEKNDGIFLLLNNFTNYFTLNYDSFLYLLLLKY